MLTASNANVELTEIMSNARESVFLTNTTTPGQTSNLIDAVRLHELSPTLDRWSSKYHAFTRVDNPATDGDTLK